MYIYIETTIRLCASENHHREREYTISSYTHVDGIKITEFHFIYVEKLLRNCEKLRILLCECLYQ